MIVFFGTFSKKDNSTARPDTTDFAQLTVQLKDDTSMLNPVLKIKDSDWNKAYNYCYIPDFSRYYYLSDATITAGKIWEITLNEDIFASNKPDILSTSAYIQYAADATNNMLPDNRITQTASHDYVSLWATPTYLSSSNYHYLLMVLGTGNELYSNSFVDVYDVTPAIMAGIKRDLFSNDAITTIMKQFANSTSCIVSLYQMPVNNITTAELAEDIHLGSYNLGITAHKVLNFIYTETKQITIPWRTEDYRRLSPWTDLKLYLPFVGVVDLSPSDFIDSNFVNVEYVLNLLTRQIVYRVSASNALNGYVATYTGQLGTTIPISSYTANVQGTVSAAISGALSVASAASGNIAAAAIIGANGLVNMTEGLLQKTPTMIGNYNGGGMEKLGTNFTCIVNYHDTIVEPNTIASTMGRPFCGVDTIGNHTGFVQTINASVQSSCTEGELAQINQALNNGLFIE